jgi:microcystin-dependent protein
MEGTIAEIRLFAGSFSPKNWNYCAGQVLNIRSNTALFSLLGVTYGGDGSTTFMLPDLRGRVAIGAGQGPGLTMRTLGQMGGSPSASLTVAEMPAHTHAVGAGGTTRLSGAVNVAMAVNNSTGPLTAASGNFLGVEQSGNFVYETSPSGSDTLNANAMSVTSSALNVNLSSLQIGTVGQGLPYNTMQPYMGMPYIICCYGVFPSRS